MVEKLKHYEVDSSLESLQHPLPEVGQANTGGDPLVGPVVGLVAGGLGGLAICLAALVLAFDLSGVIALGSLVPLCIPVGASFGLAGVTLRSMRWGKD